MRVFVAFADLVARLIEVLHRLCGRLKLAREVVAEGRLVVLKPLGVIVRLVFIPRCLVACVVGWGGIVGGRGVVGRLVVVRGCVVCDNVLELVFEGLGHG